MMIVVLSLGSTVNLSGPVTSIECRPYVVIIQGFSVANRICILHIILRFFESLNIVSVNVIIQDVNFRVGDCAHIC